MIPSFFNLCSSIRSKMKKPQLSFLVGVCRYLFYDDILKIIIETFRHSRPIGVTVASPINRIHMYANVSHCFLFINMSFSKKVLFFCLLMQRYYNFSLKSSFFETFFKNYFKTLIPNLLLFFLAISRIVFISVLVIIPLTFEPIQA